LLPYHDESRASRRVYRWRLFIAGLISVVLAALVVLTIILLSQ
jgi:hypothetical protein